MSLEPERSQEIDKLYHAALEREPSERPAFLAQACGDHMLRREIESLLAFDSAARSFLETPVFAVDLALRGECETARNIPPGSRAGPYIVGAPLGRGGMGEVYRAEDTRLGRNVALKFLPTSYQDNREALERFRREARAASALSHPGICTVHDIGEYEGKPFIVMELLEGESLKQRLERGPLTITQALQLSDVVLSALQAAHEKSIVHRDIKPANIFITSAGPPKLLDFGLAKSLGSPELAAREAADSGSADTQDDALTKAGTTIGTVAYMSPEQVQHEPLDVRTDLFSFGVTLYEAVTGRLPFKGSSTTDTLDAIRTAEPTPARKVNRHIPAELNRIISRALAKDRESRYQTAFSMRADVERLQRAAAPATVNRWHVAIVVVAAGSLMAGALSLLKDRHNAATGLTVVPLSNSAGNEQQSDFSPDGKHVVFSWDGENQNNFDLYVKRMDSPTLVRLTTHPEADVAPAWSPDGQWIAFLRANDETCARIMLIPAAGGTERALAEVNVFGNIASHPAYGFGNYLSWSPDSKWLAAPDGQRGDGKASIFLVSSKTGEKRRVTSPPDSSQGDGSPSFSPDGRVLAFSRTFATRTHELYLMPLARDFSPGGSPRKLGYGLSAAWDPSHSQIIAVARAAPGFQLWRLPLSPKASPSLVAEAGRGIWNASFDRNNRRLVFTRRVMDSNLYRIALSGRGPSAGAPALFLSSSRQEAYPSYSPDGRKVVFWSVRSGLYGLWTGDSDGSNPVPVLVPQDGSYVHSPRWSPDCRNIVFQWDSGGQWDIYMVSSNGGTTRRLTDFSGEDVNPSFSQDGKSVYFCSRRSGSFQIWRTAIKLPGSPAVQITHGGGDIARESPDGQWVYFTRSAERTTTLWRVPVLGGTETEVLRDVYYRSFELMRDGLYVIRPPGADGLCPLQFVPSANGRARTLARVRQSYPVAGLAASPDGRWLIFTQYEARDSDLEMIENFR